MSAVSARLVATVAALTRLFVPLESLPP